MISSKTSDFHGWKANGNSFLGDCWRKSEKSAKCLHCNPQVFSGIVKQISRSFCCYQSTGLIALRKLREEKCTTITKITHLAMSLQTCESLDTAACLNVRSFDAEGGNGPSGFGITVLLTSLRLVSLWCLRNNVTSTARTSTTEMIFLKIVNKFYLSI